MSHRIYNNSAGNSLVLLTLSMSTHIHISLYCAVSSCTPTEVLEIALARTIYLFSPHQQLQRVIHIHFYPESCPERKIKKQKIGTRILTRHEKPNFFHFRG